MKAAMRSAALGGLVPMLLGVMGALITWVPESMAIERIVPVFCFLVGFAVGAVVAAVVASLVNSHAGWAAVALGTSVLDVLVLLVALEFVGGAGIWMIALVLVGGAGVTSLVVGGVVGWWKDPSDSRSKPQASES